MKEIITYIHYLLHEEGKAVLPSLGTLSAHYKPAEADLSKDRFIPPAHRLQFSEIQEDASATIRQLAALAAKPEKQLGEALEEYARSLKASLAREGQATLEGLGRLQQGKNDQLRFEADPDFNQKGNAFGLQIFQLEKQAANPLEKQESAEVAPAPETKKPETESLAGSEGGKKSTSGALIVILSLIIIAGMGFLAYSYYFDPPAYLSRYMKPLQGTEAHTSLPLADTTSEAEAMRVADDTSLADTSIPVTDSLAFSEDTLPAPAGESSLADDEMAALPEEAMKPATEENYFIVAGLFRTDKGVRDIIGRLTEKGYPAKVFRSNARGIHYVCYAAYPDRESAEKALKKIRETEDPQAWIWPQTQ